MIGPGWLPRAPMRIRKRTLAYIRPRRRRAAKSGAVRAQTRHHEEVVLFDQPVPLPTAVVVPRAPRAKAVALRLAFGDWLATRWLWVRPRMIPGVAAAFGLVLALASTHYLMHAHGDPIVGKASCSLRR